MEWHDHCYSIGSNEERNFMKRMTSIAISGIFMATPAQSQMQSFEDIAALDQVVAAVTKAQPIDARLKLARCPQPVLVQAEHMGAVTVQCSALGWRIRVPVLQAATAAASAEMLVRRGETVEMVSSGSGFEISTNAVALEDGPLGSAIRVKSPTGNAVSVATVTARGIVNIGR
jgi:flagellar basal body P-ring formation protein FlgA